MIINIYGLVYPSTQEVIYVGQTRTSIAQIRFSLLET